MRTAEFTDEDYPAQPYPGARPGFSFVHHDRAGWALRPDRATASGWRVGPDGVELDRWLAERGAPPLAERVPVLAYGSNACPAKVTWLRESHAMTGPVVALRARCAGVSAVWAAGFRIVDDQRPATLTAALGVVEDHFLWWATLDQVRALDACEGRDVRHWLSRLGTGRITLEDGTVLDGALAYTAADPMRLPLLVDGAAVPCAALDQAEAAALTGPPADSDGLAVTRVDGEPSADAWPDRLFVYGTLQPDGSAWRRIAPLALGEPDRASLPGTLYDTGHDYPALRLSRGPGVPGWVVRLRSPERALVALDEYEGEDYQRIRVTLPDGRACWTYLWTAPVRDLPVLHRGWHPAGRS
ncbi:gamma-glutamylcyclotransferase [Solihabitans fulvus]|uniref:Gamma-glutamylcyclotransferase n=1 Tax=Solihabitans fulvus TaxID=1892852 RepID=A0A5B2XJJ9_9PSEU|nr:gamma-glutamylcyclotransferase family protein [Solihabitans fulvus]KAA2263010.1 gamma-glutamylcyclotransferase [Solihabitans fulvus]